MADRICRVVWVVVRTLLLAVGGLIAACLMLVFGFPHVTDDAETD